MPRDFPALTGLYRILFLYIEPPITTLPFFMVFFFPGAKWFHDQLIPGHAPSGSLDARTTIAIWQLSNCYLLVGLLSSFVFRAIRDALPNDPVAQERILGAFMTALTLADISHITASWIGLPPDLRFALGSWNPVTYGNIGLSTFLFCLRLAWFAGVGRERYYYGSTNQKNQKSA